MNNTTRMRLHETLKSATGRPDLDVRIHKFGESSTVEVTPPELQATAQATIDGFDWSDAASEAWERTQARRDAALKMTDDTDPTVKATRNTMRIVHRLLKDVAAKVNEMVGELNELATTSPKIDKLQAVRSWPQLLAVIQAQIAAETDPNS